MFNLIRITLLFLCCVIPILVIDFTLLNFLKGKNEGDGIMERYTRKDIDQEGYEIEGCGCQGEYMPITDNEPDMIDKLGKLEDIEEELGCPIEVVFKALKYGIYQEELYFPNVKNHLDAKYLRLNTWYNQLEWTDIWNGANVYEFELKDYKKTWWLREDKSE